MNKTVRRHLIDLARKRGNVTTTYQRLSDDCKLGLNLSESPYDRKVLGEISTFEHENNSPLLSSLVIRAGDNYEGDGFYKLAEELGFGYWKKLKREGIFEVLQMKKCIEYLNDDSNYNKFRTI